MTCDHLGGQGLGWLWSKSAENYCTSDRTTLKHWESWKWKGPELPQWTYDINNLYTVLKSLILFCLLLLHLFHSKNDGKICFSETCRLVYAPASVNSHPVTLFYLYHFETCSLLWSHEQAFRAIPIYKNLSGQYWSPGNLLMISEQERLRLVNILPL